MTVRIWLRWERRGFVDIDAPSLDDAQQQVMQNAVAVTDAPLCAGELVRCAIERAAEVTL